MDIYFIVEHFESDHNFLSFNTQLKYYVAYSKNENLKKELMIIIYYQKCF